MNEPQLNPQNVEAWNEQMARRYDVDKFHGHPSRLIRRIESKRVALAIRMLAPESQDKILEVGCGAGHLLAKIPCGTLHGVDLSDTLLERAKSRLEGRAEIQKADAHDLPFKDDTFDKVLCSEVLEHVLEPGKVLREMLRVSRDGATVVVTIPYEKMINIAKQTLMKLRIFNFLLATNRDSSYKMSEKMTDEWHLHAFSLALLRKFCPAGLSEQRALRLPWLAPVHFVVLYKVEKDAAGRDLRSPGENPKD
jgi:ubiquinone/menaquinone biosynthesis C-methylase UbiE